MPLTAHASAVLARARAIASLTVKRTGYDIRHIAAALTLADSAGANENVLGIAQRSFGVDLTAFPNRLAEIISTSHERGESEEAWRNLAIEPVPSPSRQTAAGPAPRRDTVVNLNADHVSASGADPLGVAADVSAFARLICLEEAKPPLSIGLFGEWGSGKSSFMERLQGEITSLTRKEREARNSAIEVAKATSATGQLPAQRPAPRFVENVVQIRFNAWHYADANLWASLTAEFFDQLRRGGHAGQRSSDYLALIGKVADRVRSLEASSQQAQLALADAEHAARDANAALAGAREKLAASDLALASEHLAKAFQDIRNDKDNAEKLKEVGRRVYRDDLGKDADAFTAAVAEASTIPGKAALIARVIAGGGWPTRLALLAIALVAIAGIGLRLGNPGELAVLVQRVIAWGGGIAAATASIWQAVRLAKPVLDGAWAYAKAVETARKTLAKEVEAKESEARKAALALAKARETADKAKAPLAKYGDGASAGAPGTILRYFLFEDSDVRDYDKQVGLVSRARRSFEQLDAIFSAARDGRAAKEKQARREPLDGTETKALTRYDAMQLDEQGVKIPDRIVLYIDDLDRCTHAQVFDVLQAIHLLLAFELFVVVVGVDVRWVEEAVARQFTPAAIDLPDTATTAEREAAQRRRETEQRKRAIDYLEKIFQLPFWLRRLSTESTGSPGGTYGAYVRDLLKANLDVPDGAANPLAPLKTLRSGAALTDAAKEAGEATAETAAVAKHRFEAETGFASLDQALATVRLTRAEVDFLAGPEIGAIAAKSPRAVKRLINVYRIIRARMSDAELAEFLGENGKPASWPIAVFLAAVETGQPVEVADALYQGLGGIDQNHTLGEIAPDSDPEGPHDSFERNPYPGHSDAAYDLIESVRFKLPKLEAVAQAIAVHRGGEDTSVADMLAMARIVRRYSFNRYH